MTEDVYNKDRESIIFCLEYLIQRIKKTRRVIMFSVEMNQDAKENPVFNKMSKTGVRMSCDGVLQGKIEFIIK